MNKSKYGMLYGVGVGPGDPELITLKAVNVLARVDKVFAASSTKNDASVALSIAALHVSEKSEVELLGFPMTRNDEELSSAWLENAEKVAEYLATGKSAAFLTLGDPLLYSTFGYLLTTLRAKHPEIKVEAIPGITSFQAAAARTSSILTESGENLQVISGVCNEEKLRRLLQGSDNTVILKAYRNMPTIRSVLFELGLAESSILASRVGHPEESVIPLADAPDKPHYFSLVLVRKAKTVQ